MEKAAAIDTCLGVLNGRDCIYLNQVKRDALDNLTFTGDINGHLISRHKDEKEWFPYTLIFDNVLSIDSISMLFHRTIQTMKAPLYIPEI